MEILDYLEAYSKAQKLSGFHFILLSAALFLLSGGLQFFFQSSDLASGLKIGALVCGLLFAVMGFSYRNYVDKMQSATVEQFRANPAEALQTEQLRMEKTLREFPLYQYVFAGIIVIGLLVVLFVGSGFWQGIAYSMILTFWGAMVIETGSSHPSMIEYEQGIEMLTERSR